MKGFWLPMMVAAVVLVLGESLPVQAQTVLDKIDACVTKLHKKGESKDALSKAKRMLDGNDVHVVVCLDGLATKYLREKRFKESELLFREVLKIKQDALGKDHQDNLVTLNNLAEVLLQQDKYEEAEAPLLQVLEINQRLLGKNHPRIVKSLNNLALSLRFQRKYEEAESLYVRELELREKNLGGDDFQNISTLNNLASVLMTQGESTRAIALYRRASEAQGEILPRIFPFMSGGSAMDPLEQDHASRDIYVSASLLMRTAKDKAAMREVALQSVLITKAGALDLFEDHRAVFQERARDPAFKTLFGQVLDAQDQRRSLFAQKPWTTETQEKVAALKRQMDEKRQALDKLVMSVRETPLPVTVKSVAEHIPEDGVLLEWTVYKPFNFKARSPQNQRREARYAVFVVTSGGVTHFRDVGSVKEVDASIERLLAVLKRPGGQEWEEPAHALYQRLFMPLMPHLKDKKLWLVSPYGALGNLPLGVLLDAKREPLLQHHNLLYLSTGRALLHKSKEPEVFTKAVLFVASDSKESKSSQSGFVHLAKKLTEKNQATPSGSEEVQILLGDGVGEEVLKGLHSPWMIHFSTDGFYNGIKGDYGDGHQVGSQETEDMRHSGIVLKPGEALDAVEVSQLDLEGTRLVVVSSRVKEEGGRGAGEGVMNLRRGFYLAGAKSQVLTLWRVKPEATTLMMQRYYKFLAQGQPHAEALRKVRLEVREDPATRHPYYWGAFTPSGSWEPVLPQEVTEPPQKEHVEPELPKTSKVPRPSRTCAGCNLSSGVPFRSTSGMFLLFCMALVWRFRRV